METTAITKYVRISRTKIARIGNEFKNKNVKYTLDYLSLLPQKSARMLWKTIKSAQANFIVKNKNANPDELIVKNIIVNEGPTLKRIRPRARGSADRVNKRTAHIKVIVTDNHKGE